MIFNIADLYLAKVRKNEEVNIFSKMPNMSELPEADSNKHLKQKESGWLWSLKNILLEKMETSIWTWT